VIGYWVIGKFRPRSQFSGNFDRSPVDFQDGMIIWTKFICRRLKSSQLRKFSSEIVNFSPSERNMWQFCHLIWIEELCLTTIMVWRSIISSQASPVISERFIFFTSLFLKFEDEEREVLRSSTIGVRWIGVNMKISVTPQCWNRRMSNNEGVMF
jgi:hypothetical protein